MCASDARLSSARTRLGVVPGSLRFTRAAPHDRGPDAPASRPYYTMNDRLFTEWINLPNVVAVGAR